MKIISKILKEALSINAAKTKVLAMMIFAMIKCEIVNLSKLSKHLKTNVKQESSYKRLQRFIKKVNFEVMGQQEYYWHLQMLERIKN